jgi:periplasmic protein TorT
MHKKGLVLLGLGFCSLPLQAAWAADWWPADLTVQKDGKDVSLQYTPLTSASKKWQICMLLPHMKDGYMVALNYGAVEEAKRQGVALTTLLAGGYDQLPKQISQFDDCIASKADAVIVMSISEAGLSAKMKEAMAKGIPVVSIGPLANTQVTGQIRAKLYEKGYTTGKFLADQLGSEGGKVVAFPGPQGSGWAERYLQGFADSLKGTKVTILAEKYGETGVPEQLALVEDALQTYPDVSGIWGGAPTAEAALGAVADAGRNNIKIVSAWENQAMLDDVRNGTVKGFATENPVIMARVAVDLSTRALEKKLDPGSNVFETAPGLVTQANIDTIDRTKIFAPEGYQPVFDVK